MTNAWSFSLRITYSHSTNRKPREGKNNAVLGCTQREGSGVLDSVAGEQEVFSKEGALVLGVEGSKFAQVGAGML